MWSSERLLSALDDGRGAFTFPVLDNGYVYLAATQRTPTEEIDPKVGRCDAAGLEGRGHVMDQSADDTRSNSADIWVLTPDGSRENAKVTWYSVVRETCCVEIEFSDDVYSAEGRDFFEALQRSRLGLEATRHRLLCWGASRNVWPSGMGRDMGRGLMAYESELGISGGALRGIFECDVRVVPSSVAQQIAWNEEWRGSFPCLLTPVLVLRRMLRTIWQRLPRLD